MNLSDTIGIAALLISILGIPITFVLARRARQRPDLRYSMEFDVILDPSDKLFGQGLYMTLEGDKIDCISRTRIAIWNQRGDTIRGSDILDADPLRLQFVENDKPLQSRVVSMSRKQIALAAIDTESAVLVNFDFLDSSDGGVLEVIHQGAMKPTVIGTLRGSAIRASASTPLGPEALVRIGHKSAARRWWDNKPRKKVAALFMLAYSAGLVAFTIWAVYSFRAEPHTLVNSAQYNLSTKDGQVAFANAIMSTRYYNGSNFFSPPWIFVWVTILALGAAFRDQYRMVRRKIPRQITMYRPLTEQPHSAHKSATG